ncbi:hypothetical protein [Paenibacillus sp. O199]|uniref:hypothetical protein n=1 Tax=Paenibacillus sp. O199 TaxID=1643925 RepID=UPI0007BFCDA5|nr:hypothetical protein [Paenibacillus sp. O199]
MKTIKFKAVNSGDGESFCFDVDRETFTLITGREPEDWMDYQSGEYVGQDDELMFVSSDPNKCRVYPNDIFGHSGEEVEIEVKVMTL